MSRIGKLPVDIPAGVTVSIAGRSVSVTGPKGNLRMQHPPRVKVTQKAQQLLVAKQGSSPQAQQQYGLTRSLLGNMVQGVSEGFVKHLEIHGVGYRAQVSDRLVTLNVGYSHPVEYRLPEGVTAKVEGNIISLSGVDKQTVGQAAAELRALRKPEPYKGKGIRHQGEYVRRKAGKAASTGTGK